MVFADPFSHKIFDNSSQGSGKRKCRNALAENTMEKLVSADVPTVHSSQSPEQRCQREFHVSCYFRLREMAETSKCLSPARQCSHRLSLQINFWFVCYLIPSDSLPKYLMKEKVRKFIIPCTLTFLYFFLLYPDQVLFPTFSRVPVWIFMDLVMIGCNPLGVWLIVWASNYFAVVEKNKILRSCLVNF